MPIDGDFNAVLDNRRLRAFHATRLFDYEAEAIRSEGLRRLTLQLVEDRIAAAYERGLLSDEDRDRCLSRNVYEIGNLSGREDRVCFVFGRRIFDHEIGRGLHPFLGGWGGEAMNGGPGPDSDPLLQRLGQPAIVEVGLKIAAGDHPSYAAPALAKAFVGKRLGLMDAFGEIHMREDVPAADVMDIWQPGHTDYDIHPHLPRI